MTVEALSAVEELTAALAGLPPLGEWVEQSACGSLGLAEVFAASNCPDAQELAVVERVCRRCPVRRECADYAEQTPVWGVWAGVWHDGKAARHDAA